MNEAAIYLEQLTAMSATLEAQMADIPDELLYRRPGAGLNNAGFLHWHILRIWDLDLSLVRQTPIVEDVWRRGGYPVVSGYDPGDVGLLGLGMGVGYSDAEVDAVRITRDVLGAYQRDLLAEATAHLSAADDTGLHAPRPSPLDPSKWLTSAGELRHMIAHGYGHIGEIRFIKGMLGFPDPTYPRDSDAVRG